MYFQMLLLCSSLSEKFFEETERRVYVTPSSYLELLGLFKSLLTKKQEEIIDNKDRYIKGLHKLEDAGKQVKLISQVLR